MKDARTKRAEKRKVEWWRQFQPENPANGEADGVKTRRNFSLCAPVSSLEMKIHSAAFRRVWSNDNDVT